MTKLVPIPTVPELAKMGLAKPVEFTKGGKPTHWKVKKKGYALIHEAEAHNAKVLKPLIDDVETKRAAYLKAQAKLQKIESRRP